MTILSDYSTHKRHDLLWQGLDIVLQGLEHSEGISWEVQ